MLSLCMIVKENNKSFQKAIKSCEKYVDEIVIVTQQKEFNWEHPKAKVYYRKWTEDFAAARNYSFNKAKGDVLFWIDSDDIVLNASKLPQLATLISEGKCDWMMMEYYYERDEYGRVAVAHWKPRLTKAGTGVWKKTIHESFEPTSQVRIVNDEDVKIDHQHLGLLHTTESGERNLKYLLKEIETDGEKTDPRTLYYAGVTLVALGRPKEAIPLLMAHIKVCGWPEERYFSMHYLNYCLKETGRLDEAINTGLEMLKIFPQINLAYYDIGMTYSVKEDYNRCIDWILNGLTKKTPDSRQYVASLLDYTVYPLSRLAHAYLMTNDFTKAKSIAEKLLRENPKDTSLIELNELCNDAIDEEAFVEGFISVADKIRLTDRVKAVKLFDALPASLDSNVQIQELRRVIVPPKVWSDKSIVIYCGKSPVGEWAYPSIFTGIGGSEEAVIYLSEELVKLGYEVTVYNDCGSLRGNYNGVEYIPQYFFDMRDSFNTLVGWRTPDMFALDFHAKQKIVWLHDIAQAFMFSEKGIANTDKFIFLSKWHRNNMPNIPDDKIFISNNGIVGKDFETTRDKVPNSLIWASSYDRGLLPFIKNIFPQIIAKNPDVKLHVAYGWNNIERYINDQPGIYPELESLYNELKPILETHPNIVHYGRLSHQKLADLMKQSICYPYASEFGETNNITSQKCQASGCYVITTSQAGGTPERVKFGKVIEGDNIYTDAKLQSQFADEVVKYLAKPITISDKERKALVEAFSWQTTAKSWKENLLGRTKDQKQVQKLSAKKN